MRFPAPTTIRGKLLYSALLGSGSALLLVGTLFLTLEIQTFEAQLERRLQIQTDMIADNVSPAMIFEDTRGARELLASLRADPAIVGADVLLKDGRPFASYYLVEPGQVNVAPLQIRQDVLYQGDVIGSVVVRASRFELEDEIRNFLLATGIALLVALLVAAMLSLWVNRAVLGPVTKLSGIARRVTENKDYSLRAEKERNDELGVLTDAFNQMLDEVDHRDRILEEKVKERTQALGDSKRRLEREVNERKQLDELLQFVIEGVSDKIGGEYFHALVLTLSRALGTEYAFVGWLDAVTRAHVDTVAVCGQGERRENFRYALAHTPCDNVISHAVCIHPQHVQQLYPQDQMLIDMGIESYAGVPIRGSAGQVVGLLVVLDSKPLQNETRIVTLLNLMAQRTGTEMQHRLDALELRKLSMAVDQSPTLVSILNPDGIIEYVNPRLCEVTGYAANELVGQPHNLLRVMDEPDEEYERIWDAITRGTEWCGDLPRRRKDGSTYWAAMHVRPLHDEGGHITHVLLTQEDITEARELSEQLAYQATHDALTGMVNRTEFERRVQYAINGARQENTEHALCYIDLDQFKVVNDTCGHVAGDVLLQQVADLWKSRVRRSDTLARLGGDEFGLLMEGCDICMAQQVAGTLRDEIEQIRFTWEGQVFRITCSIGLVSFADSTDGVTELMRQADSACYAAKDAGRNRVHLHTEDDESLAQRHGEMQWVSRINDALENDRMCLFAQPIMSLREDRPLWNQFEILVRMRDADDGLIAPGAFLGAAERYNLASHIDRWVLSRTLDWLTQREDLLAVSARCSINLSAVSLTDDGFLEFALEQLRNSGVRPEMLCFEITETAAIANMTRAGRFMAAIQEEGCCFALDDFGSGLSSFAYLKNLQVSVLKIDGAFVRDMIQDPIDHAMVQAIDQIGKVMDKQTVAEFVENMDIVEALQKIGVDYAQGYAISRPVAVEDIPLLSLPGDAAREAGSR